MPDAHLPGGPLHDGRAVGRLQPHVAPSRACTCSARRTSPTTARTASARARSCRASPTATSCCRPRSATTSRRCSAPTPSRPTTQVFRDAEAAGRASRSRALLGVNGTQSVDYFHRELGKVIWENCGMARSRAEPREGARGDPRAPRGVPEGRPGPRRRRVAQPVAREGGPRRRLPRVRRADVPRRARTARRAAAATSARSTRPTDGEALRDDEHFAYVARVGVHGRQRPPAAAQGAAGVRERPPRRSGATSRRREGTSTGEGHPARLAPGRPERPRRVRDLRRSTTSAPTCRSSRCSTC